MRLRLYMWLLCLLIIFTTTNLYPAWIDNVPNQLTQPDGTVLDVFYSGDEYHNWPHDKDNYTMIIDTKTGYVCWAIEENGDLVSTGKPVHLYTPQSLNISPRENISAERYKEKRHLREDRFRDATTRTPTLGVINELVIFIRFADDSEFSAQVSLYDDMFSPIGVGVNSLKQYYWDASYQQLEVNSPFFPEPPGNTVISYQDIQPRGYFQPYSASNPIGYYEYEDNEREQALLKRACETLAGEIPTNLNIDFDNDGYVDNCNFVIRGSAGAWSSLLWPHRSWLVYEDARIHGKRVMDYNFNIENHMNTSGVSVLAHEFGHSLGAPDYYRYPPTTYPSTPVGAWDLMSHDTNPPQSMSAYTKWFYMNWIPTPETVTRSDTYTLYPNSTHREQNCLKIPSPNSNSEYFIVEYRNKFTGIIDSTIPGSGLVIWRINTQVAEQGWGNGYGPPDEIYVFRQSGSLTSDGNISAAYYSVEAGITAINDLTNPYTFLSNGQPGGLNIHDIGDAGETISFYVDIDGADSSDVDESFESQTLTQFDWINDPAHPWTISNERAKDGSFSVASGDIGDSESSRLELSINVDAGYLQFYVQTSTQLNVDYLRFYVNNVLLQSWSGNITNWVQFPIYLQAGIYHLAWVYVKNASGSYGEDKVWIDAIGFPEITGHILYPPRNLTISDEDRDITLNWTPPFATTVQNPPTLTGYNVYRAGILLTPQAITETTFDFYSTGGYSCEYWVTAVYSNGESVRTNVVTHTIAYATATNLQATLEGDGIRLNWEYDYPLTFVNSFRVTRNGSIINSLSQQGHSLTYLDNNLPGAGEYTYLIRVVYLSPPGVSLPSNEVVVNYSSEDNHTVALQPTMLRNNYPNPFNPTTTISFDMSKDNHVNICVYNIRGQKVKLLVDGVREAGSHQVVWDGHDDMGNEVNSGIYFYRMVSGDFVSVKKMVMVK